MTQDAAANIQPYLNALQEIEQEYAKKHIMCSASLILHSSGSGAVEVEFFFTDKESIAVDFDEGYIVDAISG